MTFGELERADVPTHRAGLVAVGRAGYGKCLTSTACSKMRRSRTKGVPLALGSAAYRWYYGEVDRDIQNRFPLGMPDLRSDLGGRIEQREP
jgi:hypothetical protein